jgi:putative endonuclease
MKRFTSPRQKIGFRGEQVARDYLVKHGYQIIEKNFSCRFGEIDIIAEKGHIVHFFEVKSVTIKSVSDSSNKRKQFEHEYRSITNPFQNITASKKHRLIKTTEYYFQNKKFLHTMRFQIDGIGIIFKKDDNNAESIDCSIIHNIII